MDLPSVFNPAGEKLKFLAKLKTKASKDFKWTKVSSVDEVRKLAYWLYVLDRQDEALEVCHFTEPYQFTGNHNIWYNVECTLVLQARISRLRGNHDEWRRCIDKIRAVGFVDRRLQGDMIRSAENRMAAEIAAGNNRSLEIRGMEILREACFIIELGPTGDMTVADLELKVADYTAKLRKIAGV